MKHIPLFRSSLTTTVDDELYQLLSGFRWYAFTCKTGHVYARTSIHKKQILMHRLIMGVVHAPATLIDHKDHNGLNNQRDNLRSATRAENNRNRRSRRPYKGVHKTRTGRYIALIRHNKKSINLGLYDCPEEAARAYDKAAHKLQGEFAYVNFREVQ